MKKEKCSISVKFVLMLFTVIFLLIVTGKTCDNQRMIMLNVQLNTKFMKKELQELDSLTYKFIDSIQLLHRRANNRVVINAIGDNIFELHYTGEEPLKVMQFTDLHISGDVKNHEEQNLKAMQTVYEMVLNEQPDFIVITGDLIFGMPYSDTKGDFGALKKALLFMEKLGVPWTWTFGNHDHDFLDRLSYEETEMFMNSCSNLYMPDKNADVKGYSNAVFKVYRDNKLENVLITLDTHNGIYDNNRLLYYEEIDDTQIKWYQMQINQVIKEAGDKINSFVYMHIPTEEYALENDIISGKLREKVCCPVQKNNFVEIVKRIGSTKAIMCGHDHLNDAIMRFDELLLVYSKSIDYTAYPGIDKQHEQRGGCRLLLYKDKTFDITNIQYH